MNSYDLSGVPLSPNLAVNLKAMHNDSLPIAERLSAGFSVTLNVGDYLGFLVRLGRLNGMSWDEIAAPLRITRQTAYARYGEARPVVHMVTGVHPGGNAVWYGLETDEPGDWNYAFSRADCMTAYQLARTRADARAGQIGPHAIVNDGGIDRGSGMLWDLYVGS